MSKHRHYGHDRDHDRDRDISLDENPLAAGLAVETELDLMADVVVAKDPVSTPLPEGASRTWNGLPVYQCPYCPFDSLDRSRLEEHESAHFPIKPVAPPLIVRIDRFGNEIKEE